MITFYTNFTRVERIALPAILAEIVTPYLQEYDGMTTAGNKILTSAHQALACVKGDTEIIAYRAHILETLDVQAIRHKVHMSQEEFARHFGVSKRTVQDWEEHRCRP